LNTPKPTNLDAQKHLRSLSSEKYLGLLFSNKLQKIINFQKQIDLSQRKIFTKYLDLIRYASKPLIYLGIHPNFQTLEELAGF
jgi:hypothetical protein